MRVSQTAISGLLRVEGRLGSDSRGWFRVENLGQLIQACGANPAQLILAHSGNPLRGTLRGLHLERPPSSQWKFVTCVAGKAFDVVVDPRDDSPTYGKFEALTLEENASHGWLIAPGLAHGYLTLKPNTVMSYMLTQDEDRNFAEGVNYADPLFSIPWPASIERISDRDANFPLVGSEPPK